MSGDQKSAVTSLTYTVIICHVYVNRRNKAFGILAAATSAIRIAWLFGYSRVTVHNLMRRSVPPDIKYY